MSGEMMFQGCICCYTACDFKNILVCCKGGGTCICSTENTAKKPARV